MAMSDQQASSQDGSNQHAEVLLEAHDIYKTFAAKEKRRRGPPPPLVLDNIQVQIHAGEFVALLGPSGSGKSTILRILAGLLQPTSGEVLFKGVPQHGPNPHVAIVFQSFALFPWLTVLQNVELGLEAQPLTRTQRLKRALSSIDLIGLDGFEDAYPKELSGGMCQRVGFARALVVEPELLFMDEPFSALDVLTAENLRNELLELWINKKMPTSAIFIVTHNIEEAVLLADRIIVLGRNPARIRSDFEVGLPQWRDRKDPRFIELVDHIYKVMTQPELEHVPRVAPAPAARVRQKYQMLPHARVGGIAGLLELLHDRGGAEDLYKLSEALVMDVEDLLPIVEASVLLGFVTLNEGEVRITPQGVAFADADIQARKVLFREAVVKNVMVLQQIESVLKAKTDHSIPAEFFHDILDEHFSPDEVERQLDTALNWGRYAEIFDYDSERGRLVLAEPTLEAHPQTPVAKP